MNLPFLFLILSISGALAGTLAGLLGVGGGIIFVPVYYYTFTSFLDIAPKDAIMMATCTSLLTMIPTTISSCLSHYRKGNIDFELLKRWLPLLLLGVISGVIFARLFGGLWLSVLFGCILMFSSFNMIYLSKQPPFFNSLPPKPVQYIIAFFVSSVSVMLGIGGGTLTVPILTLFRYDTKKAIGTASTIGTIICIPGAITVIIQELSNKTEPIANAPVLTVGHMVFAAALAVIPFSMMFAPVGVSINKKISPAKLKILFSILLIVTGIKMLLNGLGI